MGLKLTKLSVNTQRAVEFARNRFFLAGLQKLVGKVADRIKVGQQQINFNFANNAANGFELDSELCVNFTSKEIGSLAFSVSQSAIDNAPPAISKTALRIVLRYLSAKGLPEEGQEVILDLSSRIGWLKTQGHNIASLRITRSGANSVKVEFDYATIEAKKPESFPPQAPALSELISMEGSGYSVEEIEIEVNEHGESYRGVRYEPRIPRPGMPTIVGLAGMGHVFVAWDKVAKIMAGTFGIPFVTFGIPGHFGDLNNGVNFEMFSAYASREYAESLRNILGEVARIYPEDQLALVAHSMMFPISLRALTLDQEKRFGSAQKLNGKVSHFVPFAGVGTSHFRTRAKYGFALQATLNVWSIMRAKAFALSPHSAWSSFFNKRLSPTELVDFWKTYQPESGALVKELVLGALPTWFGRFSFSPEINIGTPKVTVLLGAEDALIHEASGIEAASFFAKQGLVARFRAIPGLAHDAMITDSEVLAAEIAEIVQSSA
ncbi:MAG: alpha/beta hydrolase [Candidatus Saganbacteria bacterium]|nr:alpha/beta hydrolase [Candidatus Saganbacteria bacterium]